VFFSQSDDTHDAGFWKQGNAVLTSIPSPMQL